MAIFMLNEYWELHAKTAIEVPDELLAKCETPQEELEVAKQYAEDHKKNLPLPEHGSYVDGSWEIDGVEKSTAVRMCCAEAGTPCDPECSLYNDGECAVAV